MTEARSVPDLCHVCGLSRAGRADERRVAEERIADLIAFIELLESDPGGCNRCSGSDEAEAMGQYVDRVHASRDLIARVDAIRALSKPTQEAQDG